MKSAVGTWITNQPSTVQKAGVVGLWIVNKEVEVEWMSTQISVQPNSIAMDTYKNLLEEGVAPEMARIVLPQNMYTEWYWSGSLDAFSDMCKLRCGKDTQYETQIIANRISNEMKQLFPISWTALMEKENA